MSTRCRNCGSAHVKDLGFIGEVAPFFLKRVLNMQIGTRVSRHPLRQFARRVCSIPNGIFEKIYGSGAFMEMQVCLQCSFVQTRQPFSDEDLGRLYVDYRSATYNAERIRYEPTYAPIANDVGKADQEMKCRVDGLNRWLEGKLETSADFSMLDFGGSDGRFLPKISGSKFVFEISDTTPLPGIVRISSQKDLTNYSYVQIAHVLEHVSEPLGLLKHVARFMKPSGYLYIEVPQDLSEEQIAALKNGSSRLEGLPIHEHVNVYCLASIKALVDAAGLTVLHAETTPIDLGWITGTNVRALCGSKP
ncbi:MAG: class I SAM-dependent methyltransferase [Acidobacteria bacterium]|nr:class I SAM-dependent methyltransferase [Acidobacteriota bacterium]